MKVLFFDTSCDFILIGIYTLSGTSIFQDYFYSGNHPREASYRLITDIENGLKSINLEKPDAIICCKGPGSFTGLRISVSTARNLCQNWEIPVYGLDTIEMYSYFYESYFNRPVITAIDGKQKKVFVGSCINNIYKGTFDILPSEIPKEFENAIENENPLIISNTELVAYNHDLHSLLPNPLPLLKAKLLIIRNLNLQDNSYSSLLPNYMRETYAHK